MDCDEITGGVWNRVSTPAMANQQPSKPRVTNQTTSQTTGSVPSSSAQLGRHCAGIRDEGWEDEADQEADQAASTSTCSQTPTYDTVSPYSEDTDVVIEDVEYIKDGCDVDVEPDPDKDSHHRTGGGQRGATGGFEQGRGRGQRGAVVGYRRPREATDQWRGRGRHGDKPPATQQEQNQNQTRAPKGRPPTQNKTGKHAQTYDPCVTPLEVNPLDLSGTQSESAISRHGITSGERLFYGAHVGSETRNLEFKRGGEFLVCRTRRTAAPPSCSREYLRSSFRAHLRRYACAFLNSGGGSLLAGVDDDGVVRGLRCDHRQEDQARLLVDSILKGFHPTLLPHSYTLAFLPVVRPGPEGQNLKVLRLTLCPPPALTQQGLYQTDQGEVFLRRDGSVEGPLSASAIQEWARQRWSGEVSRLQHCVEVLLSEQRLLLQEIRQQSQAIAAMQSAQTQAQSQAHIHVHTHTQARAHVKTPATESLGDRLMQILRKAGRATPLDQEVPSVPPPPPSSALPLVPFMAPDLDVLQGSPGRIHLWPSLSPGHNQGPGPPHCPQCQCTECRSNICRLM